MRKFLLPGVLLGLSLCLGCSQDDYVTVITDGAEAATVAGVLAISADPATAPFVAEIVTGLTAADEVALDILAGTNTSNTTLTLEQLLNLAFVKDPNLAKYQSLIKFVLPILMDIPGVSGELNKVISQVDPTVIQDVTAFFTGIQNGLGDAPGTTAQQVIDRSPKLKAAVKQYGIGKFDPTALVNSLKSAAKK